MAASSHPLSTLTAVNILQKGGNAVDAAVAAIAVQCVVEPGSTGIGGDCFCHHRAQGQRQADRLQRLGSGAGGGDARMVRQAGDHQDRAAYAPFGHHSRRRRRLGPPDRRSRTSRPGARCWNRPSALPATAILSLRASPSISTTRSIPCRATPRPRRIFLPGGKPPRVGQLHRQPELAATLALIAEKGRDAFYGGPVAKDMVDYLRGLGGLHTMDDFAAHQGEYVTPIRTAYRGYDVCEIPPNGQGLTALILLNILSGFDMAQYAPMSPERLHLEIEATRLAYADRNAFIADPRHAKVPVEDLLSAAHADDLRAPDHSRQGDDVGAAPATADPSRHRLSVRGRRGPHRRQFHQFVVQRLRQRFGGAQNWCGIAEPRLRLRPRPGPSQLHRAQEAPLPYHYPRHAGQGRAGRHALRCHGRCLSGVRAMPMFWAESSITVWDIQEAMDQSRVFPTREGVVEVESSLPAETLYALHKYGHRTGAPSKPQGGSQAIWIDWDEGVLTGGSDPRKDGCAIGY